MKNEVVEDRNGYKHTLTHEIARGGQGVVYRTQNPNIAVKLAIDKQKMEYSRDVSGNAKFDFLRTLPLPENICITLPQVTLCHHAGYAMTLLEEMESFESAFAYSFDFETEYSNGWLDELREKNADCANDFAQYIVTGGIRRRLEAYFRCAAVLAVLHAAGLVYCDLSTNNIFVSKKTAKAVWLIDADNIDFQSETFKKSGYYTPGYAAPEIVRGKGSTFYSDCYSFAVSLFWNLTWNHPFMGAMADEEPEDDFADDAQERAYRGEYPWIFDAVNEENHWDPKVGGIPPEMFVGPGLMQYFDRTFSVKGKEKPATRTTMFEWMHVLAETMDHTIRCPRCGMDYYAEDSEQCPRCKRALTFIRLVTYRNGIAYWEYKHEMTDQEAVPIPLRVLEGAKSSNMDKTCFYVRKDERGYAIFDLNEEYDFGAETEDNGVVSVFGEVRIAQKSKIIAVHSKTHSELVIEVTVR